MADHDISKLKVADLKRELRIRGLKVSGKKNELAQRLQPATKIHIKEPNLQCKRDAKKRKLNHEEFREQSSIILKIPVELIEYIFDYLDLDDLSAVSATCKRMQQLAGRVYQKSYSGLFPLFQGSQRNWEVQICREYGTLHGTYIEYLIPFIDKMYSRHDKLKKYLHPGSKFQQLRQLLLQHASFNTDKINRMKRVLGKLEYIKMLFCKMDDCFLENLLSLSPNLNRLCVTDSDTGQRWLQGNYPTLKHCEINCNYILPITTLLTRNPNIRKFGINAKNLWENRFSMKAAGVNLEVLAIEIGYLDDFDEIKLPFYELLDEYCQLGIYKRLNLYYAYMSFNQNFIDGIANVTALDRLTLDRSVRFDSIALSCLTYLEDISFPDSRFITDIESVATEHANLKFIYFGISSMSHVKMFIGGNLKLERLQIDWFIDEAGNIEDEKVLNLIALNKDRSKLPNAKKIILYVEEPVYLATKRANRETDLEFIQLKRADTLYDREFDFHYRRTYMQKPYYMNMRHNPL